MIKGSYLKKVSFFLFLFVSFLYCYEKVDLFEMDKELYGWRLGLGQEFKGAKGSLTIDEQITFNGKPSLKLTGDFSEGGKYVEALKLNNLDIESFYFWVKYPKDILTFRVGDSSGQCHQIKIKIKKTDDWQLVRFPLKKFFENMGKPGSVENVLRYQYWGGKKDGKWHPPAKFISITLSPDKNTGNKVSMWMNEFIVTVSEKEKTEQITEFINLDELLKLGKNDWNLYLGTEFKGAKGSLDVIKENGQYCLKLSADFTGGGAYIDMGKSLSNLNVKKIKAIHLKLKSENVSRYSIRIIDSSGQVFQKKGFKLIPDGKWHDAVIDIDGFNGAEHWAGANDGKVHHPIKNFRILIATYSSPDKKPIVYVKDVKAEVIIEATQPKEVLNEDFEKVEEFLKEWEIKGNIEITEIDVFEGKRSLKLERDRKNINEQTFAFSPYFRVKTGILKIQGAGKSDLYSPDNSYCGRVYVEFYDGNRKVIEKREVVIFTGKTNWKTFIKEIEVPQNSYYVRVGIELLKTHGYLLIDDLKVFVFRPKDLVVKKVQRIEISSARIGNLFYPDDEISLNFNIKTSLPLSESEKLIKCEIKDYWGANQIEPVFVKLENFVIDKKGLLSYKATLNLKKDLLEVGKYYEIHITVPQQGKSVKDFSTFAILPEAITKKYKPEEIPFTQRNWDNRITEYFLLSDRLGIRICGIWSGFDYRPPYKPHAPGLEIVNKLGMKWVAGTPGGNIERKRGNWQYYTEEVLKEGMKKFVETYKDKGLYYVCLGNEPPTDMESAIRNTKAYKAMYQGVKEVDPNIVVLGTSVGPCENYFKAGFQNYLDMYDFHTYEDYRKIPLIFERYKELFRKYGGEKPICSTEIGLNSQGMARIDVAESLIKKTTLFFACGGSHMSWFGILYPDPKGIMENSAGQAHNIFYCKYNLYAPKLDAIAYYNMVNGICVKKFVESKVYPDGTEIYIFRDKEGNTLMVIWNDKKDTDFSLPLPETDTVEIIRIDGSKRKLKVRNSAVNINVLKEEPVLVLFTSKKQFSLPDVLKSSWLKIVSKPEHVIEGGSFEIVFAGKNISSQNFEISVPYGVKTEKKQKKEQEVSISVNIPESFDARQLRMRMSSETLGFDFHLSMPVVSKIDFRVLSYPACLENGPAVKLILKNNDTRPQKIVWSVTLEKEFPMENGTFNLQMGQQPEAYFKDLTSGTEVLHAGQEKEILLKLEKVNPLSIYQVRFIVNDEYGREIEFRRYISGFLGAPYRKGEIKIDGDLSEKDWKSAPSGFIKEQKQVYYLKRIESELWKGPEDLSGEVKFLWDEKYLYIGVEVTDDIFSTPYSDSLLWNQDGIQFLFDPKRGEKEKKGKYDISIGLGKKEPQGWCHLTADPAKAPSGEIKEAKIGIKRKGNKTIYEIALPWERISPFVPASGENLGVAMIINEDDGKGRVSFMGWFGGVHSKQIDMVGDLILIGK